MKKIAAILTAILIAKLGSASVRAGDREWATAGKILTGVVAGTVIAKAFEPRPAPVYHTQTVVYQPAPQPVQVVYAPAPPPVVYAPAPVVYAPAPVVYAPAPVVYAPAPVVYAPAPVVVAQPVYVHPAPVIVRPAPVCVAPPPRVSFHFSFGGHHHRRFCP